MRACLIGNPPPRSMRPLLAEPHPPYEVVREPGCSRHVASVSWPVKGPSDGRPHSSPAFSCDHLSSVSALTISLWASRSQARGRGWRLGTLRDWPGEGTGVIAAAYAETVMFSIQWDQSDMSHLPIRDLTENSAVQCKTVVFSGFRRN